VREHSDLGISQSIQISELSHGHELAFQKLPGALATTITITLPLVEVINSERWYLDATHAGMDGLLVLQSFQRNAYLAGNLLGYRNQDCRRTLICYVVSFAVAGFYDHGSFPFILL
jgi:hypothetical protein